MTENEFLRQSQAAVERMREMNRRSQIPNNNKHKMPPVPSFVKVNENNSTVPNKSVKPPVYEPLKPDEPNCQENSSNSLNIPLLDNILKDGDSALILGLLLILMSENADKILLFALVYILL